METCGNKKLQKVAKKFHCHECDYFTCRKSSFLKHLQSIKHKFATISMLETNGNTKKLQNSLKKTKQVAKKITETQFSCSKCLKSFQSRSGIWKHQKSNCCIVSDINKIVYDLINDNKELREIILEQSHAISNQTNAINNILKTGGANNVSNNTNCMNNNQTFNLQIFLNETCKDAMNLSEFVESIQLDLADLEETGRVGYVEGISKVVINNLNSLNVHLRPIHCSDAKREILYIKDNNEWKKENENKEKMKHMIKQIANKNIKNITEWIKENPSCVQHDSKQNDKYLKIVSNSMSGDSDLQQQTNISKIISKVAKQVIIQK
jgi:hypothetical protein